MSMLSDNSVVLIIPVYNGEEYLLRTCEELETYFVERRYLKEIIFVDDGSTDNTHIALKNSVPAVLASRVRVLHYKKNRGKGYAIMHALSTIDDAVSFFGFTDVEIPYGLSSFEEALFKLFESKDIDVVIGNRKHKDQTQVQYSWYRQFCTRFFRLLLPKPIRAISDTQSGLKVFKGDVGQKLFSLVRTYRWVFDIELLLAVVRGGFSFYEMPVSLKSSCLSRTGGVSLFRHGPRILYDMIRIYLYDRKSIYNSK